LELPIRRIQQRNLIPIDEEHSYVPSVNDLINDALQEIEVPFDCILGILEREIQ